MTELLRDDEPQGTEPQALADLLFIIRDIINRFIVVDEPAKDMLALWVVHTYVFREFDVTPYLAIMSPMKRSGKTNLITILESVCADADMVIHTSTAALYNQTQLQPTMLFDEGDLTKLSDTQRKILNSGYKAGAFVAIQRNRKTVKMQTFCPKAFSSIGHALSATMTDRAIPIHLFRKNADEQVERLTRRRLAELVESLPDRLANYRADFIMPDDDPVIPDELNDREYEIWLPLFVVAEQAGPHWKKACWEACLALTEASRYEEVDETVLLLRDIKTAFGSKKRMHSAELLNRLQQLSEPEYSGPATQSPKALANTLAPFRVYPKQIRVGSAGSKKGYSADQFNEAFTRYLDVATETTETPNIYEEDWP